MRITFYLCFLSLKINETAGDFLFDKLCGFCCVAAWYLRVQFSFSTGEMGVGVSVPWHHKSWMSLEGENNQLWNLRGPIRFVPRFNVRFRQICNFGDIHRQVQCEYLKLTLNWLVWNVNFFQSNSQNTVWSKEENSLIGVLRNIFKP